MADGSNDDQAAVEEAGNVTCLHAGAPRGTSGREADVNCPSKRKCSYIKSNCHKKNKGFACGEYIFIVCFG